MSDWSSLITVGRIVRPQGNRGQVVVAPETDFGEARFRTGASLLIQRAGEVTSLVVTDSREKDGRWIVGFDGVRTIDDAEALRGLELRIPGDALMPVGGGRYYLHDLVGCRVETTTGEMVGSVARVDTEVGTPVLVLTARGGDVLVPFAEEICRRIEPSERLIVIDPPEGLLDLNRVSGRGTG